LVDESIGFAEFVPALAGSQDDELAAEIEEHRWANLAGECALLFGIHVLCPKLASSGSPASISDTVGLSDKSIARLRCNTASP
jgi:hypothetical protein